MYGFTGKILVVDLTAKSSEVLEKSDAFYKQYLGGSFLAAKLFADAIQGERDLTPFSPGNAIVFATGLLAGARICGSTRVNVVALSPETTGIYTSQGGGDFGPDMKRAGFDALVIRGQSETPVYLDIHNAQVTIADAGPMWGRDRLHVYHQLTDDQARSATVASIGPAGENRVRHANIMFEPDHYAGRGGLGAVMGAKRLKAIRIGGDREVVFKDPQMVKAVNQAGGKTFMGNFQKSPNGFLGVLRNYGTFGLLALNQGMGNLPVSNFKEAHLEDERAAADLDHDRIAEVMVGQRNPCKGCYLGCKKKSRFNSDHTALAEYESIAMLGPNLGLKDLTGGLEAVELCNLLGMDTISTGAMLSYLMHCFESGDLDEDELGFSIRFGQSDKACELIRMIAAREGKLGSLLADGIEHACQALGPETARHLRFSKGLGLPAHMPRVKPGIGFGYLHGPNPGDHMKAEHDWIASSPDDLQGLNISITSEPFDLDANKVEIFRDTQIYYSFVDCLSMCLFIFGPGNILTYAEIVDMVNAATGFDYTFEDLMQIGENAIQLQRKLYIELGGSDEALLPFMEEEIPAGPTQGNKISKKDFAAARRHYYRLWGWDDTV